MKSFWSGISLLLLIVAFDQATKLTVLNTLHPEEIIPIIPGFFNLILTFNEGAAFGFMANVTPGTRELLLAGTTLLALGVVVAFMRHRDYQGRIPQLALWGILGGALGNVIDRIWLGAVIDFLDFYISSYHWPAFNIADSAICVGVTVLLLSGLLDRSPQPTEPIPDA